MSLLFPAMLLGALGLAIPVALHWIARSRFPEQPFPSIRLLRLEQRHNVFARRLVDPLQLLLRLLVGLLLVLAMARLFVPAFGGRSAPRNLVVVLDASASMRLEAPDPAGGSRAPLLQLAAQRAAGLLKAVEPPGRTALIAAGDELRVLAPLRAGSVESVAALDRVVAGDGTGPGLVRAVSEACDLLQGRREARSQIVVLTDLRAAAFETRRQADLQRVAALRRSLGRSLEIWFVDVAGETAANAAVVEARVRGGEVRLGDDAHVLTRIRNAGTEEREVGVRLDLGGKTVAQGRAVQLTAGGECVFDLTAPMNRPLQTLAEAQLAPPDAAPADDRRLVPVRVVDATRVLIVRGAGPAPAAPGALERLGGGPAPAGGAEDAGEGVDGATVLRYVLNPGRELGLGYSTGLEPALTSVDAFGEQPLSKYDVVVLYDVDQLPERALEDLDAFVRGGRSVLIFCSAACNPVRFNRVLAAGAAGRAALAPARLGNDREYAQAVGLEAGASELLAPFRDRLQGDLSVVRFSRLRELQGLAEGAAVVMGAADGLPLAVESRLEHGRVMLLTFGLELDRGNVARTRVFPVLVWRLMDVLTGRDAPRRPDILAAAEPAVLEVSEPAFAFETEIELAGGAGGTGAVRRLAITPERTVLLPALPAGAYTLSKPRREAGAVVSYQRPLAVNPDARESRMERIGTNELARLAGPAARFAAAERLPDLAARGRELWLALAVLLLAAYIAEGVVGFWTSARRERMSADGGPAV